VPCQVTIYSESESYEPFDDFGLLNYTLELDSLDLGNIWKPMIGVDEFILTKRCFSLVPAILSNKTVVYTPFW
jgi:hypothetical protein